MSEIERTLAKWLTKAKTMPAPPAPSERRGSVPHEKVRANEPIRQLNLKIPESTYRRIKGLAHRDRRSLVAMLDEMLALYERAHGTLEER
jgi:hypothetical protein